jgi:L-2-hydroxyglutarate oxidase LhgO
MYSYCEVHGVPYKRAGKLIVATQSQQVPVLEKLAKVGKDNGVTDLCLIEASEAQEMEPQLQCVKALWSPSSGILDSHSFMLALQVITNFLDLSLSLSQIFSVSSWFFWCLDMYSNNLIFLSVRSTTFCQFSLSFILQ